MSSPKTTEPVGLAVHGDPATEIFVLDGELNLVARGLGDLKTELPPGLYKIKFKSGPVVDGQHVFLEPGSPPVSINAPALSFSSAAPLNNTRMTHEYHMAHAEAHSRKVGKRIGRGGRLFVFARAWTEPGRRAQVTNRHPAAGLTLCSLRGEKLLDLRSSSVSDLREDPWAACNIELTPGAYRLRVRTKEFGPLEQTIVVSKDWQTQVFLLAEPEQGSRELRVDLSTASILMARPHEGFHTNAPDFRLTEAARLALVEGRAVLAAEILDKMLNSKFLSPMLGILGAVALTLQDPPDLRRLQVVVSNLERLVPGHPDVLALRVFLERGRANLEGLSTPPMLRRSWILAREAVWTSSAVPATALSRRVAPFLWGAGPWLIWMADKIETRAPSARAIDPSQVAKIVNLSQSRVDEPATRKLKRPLNDGEEALLSYLVRSSKYQKPTGGPPVEPAGTQAAAQSSTKRPKAAKASKKATNAVAAPAAAQAAPSEAAQLARTLRYPEPEVQDWMSSLVSKLSR